MTTVTLRDFPPVEENVERPDSIRQSLAAKYDKCPRAAMLYLKYGGGTETHEKTRGTIFHRFMERATETMLELGEPTMPGDVGRELADAIMAEDPSIVLSTDEQDVVRQCAWNWCEATALDLEALIGVEIPLEMQLGGFTITGTIDRAEAFEPSLHLHDAKTSLAIRKREEVQRGFQGQLYALLCIEGVHRETGLSIGAGINDVWFWEDYPRYRTDEGPLITKDGSWTRPEIHEFKVSLEQMLGRLEHSFQTGEWPARDGSWCSTCPAQTECPIPAHLRYVEEVTSEADAEAAFSHKLALERESRRLQSGLRGWVQGTERPIYVGDYAFDATLSESKEVIDWNELILALHRTSELGAPFEMTNHIRIKQSTKFAKRKQTEEEHDERN
jgi:RecB family exonuclease